MEDSSTVKIQEVKNVNLEKRVASHSHISGLGLNEAGFAMASAGGFVGQGNAREVCRHAVNRLLTQGRLQASWWT